MGEQSLFSKYLGRLQVEVDEIPYDLDVKLKDKHKIMSIMKDFNNKPEETLENLAIIYKEIIKRSYPEETDDSIDAFLTKKFEAFMTSLSIAFGWTTKEDLKKSMEEREKK
jgi:hypothetical protein